MTLKPPSAATDPIADGTGVLDAVTFGAAYSYSAGHREVSFLHGTLTADLTLTLSALPVGGIVICLFTQDGTGGWELTVTDLIGPGSVSIAPGATLTTRVDLISLDGINVYAGEV